MFGIETADHRHIRAISLLSSYLYEEMAILRPDYCTAGHAEERLILEAIDNNKHEILVAVDNETVIGFAHIIEKETQATGPKRPLKYAYITEIVVDPVFRGIGIGTALISAAKKWARNRSLGYLEISVLNESEEAVLLYKREAFETVVQTMRCLI